MYQLSCTMYHVRKKKLTYDILVASAGILLRRTRVTVGKFPAVAVNSASTAFPRAINAYTIVMVRRRCRLASLSVSAAALAPAAAAPAVAFAPPYSITRGGTNTDPGYYKYYFLLWCLPPRRLYDMKDALPAGVQQNTIQQQYMTHACYNKLS